MRETKKQIGSLWALSIILTFTLTIYLISFIVFIFQGNSLHLLPQLGPGGWLNLYLSLPWILLFITFIVFVLLQGLIIRFSFAYKRPPVHTVLISIILVVLAGVLISQTSFQEKAYEAHKDGFVYRNALRDRGEVYIGAVTQINGGGFNIKNRGGYTYIVSMTPETKIPPFRISVSTIMMVMGPEKDGIIEAVGIHPIIVE